MECKGSLNWSMAIVPKRHRTVPGNRQHRNGHAVAAPRIDRISSLPDAILCHILSYLPTKEAVGSSILSTRWKNLFPLIPNVRLKLEDSAPNTNLVSFKNFVDQLLNVTLHSIPHLPPSVNNFHLSCERFNDGRQIAKWIDAALNLNVKEIDLYAYELMYSRSVLDSFFGANITFLGLSLEFSDDVSEFRFSLPNLESLSVQFMECNVINALLKGCPALKNLVLYYCLCSHGEVLQVCVASLGFLSVINIPDSLDGDFKLDAPQLEELWYEGYLPNRLVAERLKSLHSAHLDPYGSFGEYPDVFSEQAYLLFQVCSGAENLGLTGSIAKMFYYCPLPMPKLPRLIGLVVLEMDFYVWELLLSLLDTTQIYVNLFIVSGFDYGSYKKFKASLTNPMSICLTRHGKTHYNITFSKDEEV